MGERFTPTHFMSPQMHPADDPLTWLAQANGNRNPVDSYLEINMHGHIGWDTGTKSGVSVIV